MPKNDGRISLFCGLSELEKRSQLSEVKTSPTSPTSPIDIAVKKDVSIYIPKAVATNYSDYVDLELNFPEGEGEGEEMVSFEDLVEESHNSTRQTNVERFVKVAEEYGVSRPSIELQSIRSATVRIEVADNGNLKVYSGTNTVCIHQLDIPELSKFLDDNYHKRS